MAARAKVNEGEVARLQVDQDVLVLYVPAHQRHYQGHQKVC